MMYPERIPAATYRLQFNQQFRLADARALVPYLHALGITDLYASPLLQARRDSAHGYDVTDPTRLNPALGDEEEFAALAKELQEHGMGLVLDIVPNHMAASGENPWWRDVLRHGPESPYAGYFDIDWQPARSGLAGKVVLPILGDRYGRVLENRELTLALTEDGFVLRYRERTLPVNPRSHGRILAHRLDAAAAALGPEHPVLLQFVDLANLAGRLPGRPTAAFRQVTERLWQLYNSYPEAKSLIDENLQIWNGRRGDPRSFDRLDGLLTEQCYRLTFWRAANQELNYRRFFDLSDLVSVRVEDEEVFSATHGRILRLAKAGWITGLRIDHIDGLHDPESYLRRLQGRLSRAEGRNGFYVVVEKILGGNEELPDWPCHGTTGYDFMNLVNGLFVDGRAEKELEEIYARLGGTETDFAAVVESHKRRMARELFAGEMRALARRLGRLAERDRHGRDLTLNELEAALVEVTVCLPVYRTYTRDFRIAARDRQYIEGAVATARRRQSERGPALEFLRRVLLLEFPANLPAADRESWLSFVMRWQQFTGPIMAKGFEDTALYVYNRLVSLNEVGGEPRHMGVPVAEFHQRNRAKRESWPHSLNATSTHDNKRSEDVRTRIDVLSEIPALWGERLDRWRRWNRPRKPVVHGQPVPDDNTELLLYQTLVGAWPLREGEVPAFRERLQNYVVKAAREAKVHTSWLDTDTNYENALVEFVAAILEPGAENRFLPDFVRFQQPISFYGALNSLAQVLLKIAAPGVPDFYQGTELWDFSLVDPDNRRPVDFQTRAALLAALQEREKKDRPALLQEMLTGWKDGRVKLYLTYKALHFRRAHQELFVAGEYIPLEATGRGEEHVCAFARRLGGVWALVAVPRLPVRLLEAARPPAEKETRAEALRIGFPLGEEVWDNSVLLLPGHAPGRWRNVLTGEAATAAAGDKRLPLAGVFGQFPVTLLAGES
jgi:(1->4)-alpha-D-glucan 1-alpha-D-glucosylmutase